MGKEKDSDGSSSESSGDEDAFQLPCDVTPSLDKLTTHKMTRIAGTLYFGAGALLYLFPQWVTPLIAPLTLGDAMIVEENPALAYGCIMPLAILLMELSMLYWVSGVSKNVHFDMNACVHRAFYDSLILVVWVVFGLTAVDLPIVLIPPDLILTGYYLYARYHNAAMKTATAFPSWWDAVPFAAGNNWRSVSPSILLPGVTFLSLGLLGSITPSSTSHLGFGGFLTSLEGFSNGLHKELRFAAHLVYGLLAVLGYHDITTAAHDPSGAHRKLRLVTNLVIRPALVFVGWLRYPVPLSIALFMTVPGFCSTVWYLATYKGRIMDDILYTIFPKTSF
eukprot:scpid84310/ scgid26135/ 